MTDHPLPLTGERTLPGVARENYWFRRHEAAYRFCADRCRGLVVDAGCGEGYGADLLRAAGAGRVVGVELRPEVVAHARRAYPDVAFVEADVCAVPLPDASADAVVSLQVIEHLWDVPRYLAEVRRLLRPGGAFYCATPNRLTFSPDGRLNICHTVEFTAAELRALLGGSFAEVELWGVHHAARLRAVEASRGRSLPALQLDHPPEAWPSWLAALVAGVTVDNFAIRRDPDDLDASLDLLAACRVRRQAGPGMAVTS